MSLFAHLYVKWCSLDPTPLEHFPHLQPFDSDFEDSQLSTESMKQLIVSEVESFRTEIKQQVHAASQARRQDR